MSFRVSAGMGTGTPGTFTPLCELTVPPTTTAQRARPAWTASTRSRTSPSSIRTSWPGWSTWPITAGRTGSSPSTLPSSPPVTTTSSPSASSIGASSSPMRSFGPWRSAISATGRPTSSCAFRTMRAYSACCSCVPCEKLRRAPSIPACASAITRSSVAHDGPSVTTIFVRRGTAVAICVSVARAGSTVRSSSSRPRPKSRTRRGDPGLTPRREQ